MPKRRDSVIAKYRAKGHRVYESDRQNRDPDDPALHVGRKIERSRAS
jgi:hypothetical protein